MAVRSLIAYIGLIIICLGVACNNHQPAPQAKAPSRPDTVRDYLPLVLAMDTLTAAGVKKEVALQDSLLRYLGDSTPNPWYHYFRGRQLVYQKHRDSAVAEFSKMQGNHADDEIELLRRYSILEQGISGGVTVDAAIMNQILNGMKTAERVRSQQTYRYYDLMARAYYQNQNVNESLEYAERYYKSHPFKSHPVVMQRHYDISFLLASRLNDFDKMMFYNAQARTLAHRIKDSMAIARTYDNESQIYVRQGQNDKALAASRAYIEYLQENNSITDIAYNNLATTFMHNNMLDSAIHYYQEAIEAGRKNPDGKQNSVYFKGLIKAYRLKGDYRKALQVAEATYDIEINTLREIEAVRFAEIHEKYETEKKDRNIAELSNRNLLNEKIIKQQKWTLILAFVVFLAVLSIFYFIQRQYRLEGKNRLLQSENQRLIMEQKLLQVQLNPHFIFNSIANLQSLVASGDTKDSVRYLSAFSGLLRNILEQSRKDFIGLDEEITTLSNYLQLQQMRFYGLFDYKIATDENIYPENILIPPMLIQPFVENAIEHGFRNIDYKGILTIVFKGENEQLNIIVEDNGNGIGSKEPGEQKKQSLASVILKERLDVLFKSQGQEAYYHIEDKKDQNGRGVKVTIVIPQIKD
ncbi:Histidine kinase [Chitinophaga jiangningensis]|uniref:Histidine kinase n=1 Tax=Chitinophaga jiangningensis TaxID=1419482 RepID=A0A1M7F6L1_9BACT|nr:histidine kinase [Chitinophaga jiangningensis]SHL99692.1 Histidine kinase [Chitinophaga jiangningensis]